jgi:lactoylglutathione lyase
MKRVHVHIAVGDLAAAVAFYTRLLGAAPVFQAADYASWALASPSLNLAVSTRHEGATGVSHLGVETDDVAEVATLAARVQGAPGIDEGRTSCCYARSTKRWVEDPDGVSWELFQTEDRIGSWSLEDVGVRDDDPKACCPAG